ncbi:MAG: hypothetical protein H6837_08500 [Planctomycetes bacterium]|nr:hypothetical protein [Planctomycetota bacterium]
MTGRPNDEIGSRHDRPDLLVLVLALWIAAAACYPGWNAFEPNRVGFDPCGNFVCDLLSGRTPDGRTNFASAACMATAVLLLVFGALLHLWLTPPASPRLRPWCRASGLLAAGLALGVCVEQAFALPLPHGTLALSAAAAGAFPTGAWVAADWRRDRGVTPRRMILALMCGAAVVEIVGYSVAQLGGPLTRVVPTTQNLAFLGLLGWLAARRRYS